MYKIFLKNIFITLAGILLITSCGVKSNNVDFDFSTLKLPKKKVSTNSDLSKDVKKEKKEVALKLIRFDKREEIFNSVNYGKKDPFAISEDESNLFISNIKLNGFISFQKKDYALIEFQNQRGFIDINSVGGINTKLLPKDTYVKDINPKQEQINLLIGGEDYTIKLYF